MKIIKIVVLLLVFITLVGCEEIPEINQGTLNIEGINDIEYVIGSDIPNYLEGVNVLNNLGERITDIEVDDDEVNYDVMGTYTVYYYIKDKDGTSTMTAITVSVIEDDDDQEIDYNAPYFEGIQNIEYFVGEETPDYISTIKAFDVVDGDLTLDIMFEGEADFEVPGTYTIKVTVYDLTGNRRIETFTITVFDNQKPIISGYHRIYHIIGDAAPDYTKLVEAYDQEDGTLTDVIEVNDALVDLNIEGIYPLSYKVTDSFGHVTEHTTSVQVEINDYSQDIDALNIYYINDTHGSILEFENEMGLAKIGNIVVNEYDQNPYETLFLSGGDLLQGNVLSNFYYGASMIDMFNYMNLEVFVLGNHEFDWGIDKITEYFNPNTLGMQAEFPLLAANMFYKGTEIRPDYIDAYSIIQKGDLKIGVVGTIGSGLESSIAKSRVEDYEFKSPTYWTQYYTELLRTAYDVDVVFAISHGNDNYFNQTLSTSSGNQKINAIFNGHTHSSYADVINGTPLMQSASNARALGYMSFQVDSNNSLALDTLTNLFSYSDQRLQSEHLGLKQLIDTYVDQIEPLLNEAILYSSADYGRDILTTFMAEVIRKSADADVGIHNSGGTRDSLSSGQPITVGTTYKIFPFDNQIISVKMLGTKVISLLNNSSVSASLRPGFSTNDINPQSYYWVSTNDYVFGNYDEFQNYIDIYYPGVVDRVAFEDELRERAESTNQFIID